MRLRLGPRRPRNYQVNVAVARDGTKAVITAQNNPTISDDGVAERIYCA
jgi:hypothetical protein